NLCIEAWRATFEIERPGSLARRTLDATPDWLLIPLGRVIPTFIYRIESSRANRERRACPRRLVSHRTNRQRY
ncbi:MAG: hypothetical protein ACRD22_09020, partial [Terriglobia bacterium]